MRNIKISAVLTSFLFIFAVFLSDLGSIRAEAAFTPDLNPYSEGYYMVNLDLGTVIAAKNEHERYYPASVTKIMTAIVALEHCADLSTTVKVTYEATNEFWTDDPNFSDAATAGIAVGQTNLTMEDCLYALMLSSACEVANVIAYNVGGESIPNFVDMMNAKATELGCTDTHFSNPHGLWEKDNYSSAYDLFLIAQYAYEKVPKLMEICDATEYVLPANIYNPNPYTITSYNSLIRNIADNPFYYEYARGIKTGSINVYWDENGVEQPGFCNFVSTASMNGFTYMLVTMNAPYYEADGTRTQGHFKDHIAFYKWAFRTFDILEVLNENTVIASVAVDMGENTDIAVLKPSSSFSTLLPMGLDLKDIKQVVTITAEMNDNNKVVAPIEKGQVMGTLDLYLNDEFLATRSLISSQRIELSQFEYTMRMINSIFDQGWFKLCIAALAVLIILDIVLNSVQKSRIAKLEARQKRRGSAGKAKW
ncbi:MAG: D-alanyl-D-alanine carboxypeptidase [Bacteroides sp.]|nr:D-alanyl-D-alanine carboxypeptidase [Eubacterium sp.]MCM1419053.1 D-alanyl-D-alanine carboxypeptidase [Roseburia sp.]MCM1461760.1 D-alanyl-D-alanine carboxypeptidase [Bacteroides sp.]